jgi:curli biogenesis system outer membrane secretion channel CsgG
MADSSIWGHQYLGSLVFRDHQPSAAGALKQMSRTIRLIYPLLLLAVSGFAQQATYRPHGHSSESAKDRSKEDRSKEDRSKEDRQKEQLTETTAAVAVMDFDTHAVEQSTASIYGNFQDIGRGVTSLLAEKLAKDGFYRVVNRKTIDSVLAEQNVPVHARTDAVAVARISRPLGIDLVILGSVTKFSREETRAPEDMGVTSRALSTARLKKSELQAVCAITVQLVDAKTGEVMASFVGEGRAKRPGSSLFSGTFLNAANSSGSSGLVGFDPHEPNFSQTLMGEAVTKAVNTLSAQLESKAATLPMRKVEISGVVADAPADGTLIVNIGSKTGLRLGDTLEIARIVRLVTDPKTGKILTPITERIGEATVTEMNTEFSTLIFNGGGTAKVGDVATTAHTSRASATLSYQQEKNQPISPASSDDNSHVLYAPH